MELWWKRQKYYENSIPQIINREARSLTGMYSSTPINPLPCKTALILAVILLNYRQRVSSYQLLSLPDLHPTKKIPLISLKKRYGGFQRRELLESNLI